MLVTYEARTGATDAASRRAFLRYWRPLSPFIGVVMRAMLAAIDSEASARREALEAVANAGPVSSRC